MNQSIRITLLALFLSVGILAEKPALAMTPLSVMGGLSDTVNDSGAIGFVGGVALNLSSFEADALYLSHRTAIEVPVMYLFTLAPLVTFGVGAYDDIPTSGGTNIIGALGSLRIGLGPLFSDLRFTDGFIKNSGVAWADLQLMIGVNF